jgi:hypothetical protein
MRANALAAIVLGLFLLSGGCSPTARPQPKYRVELLDDNGNVRRQWMTKSFYRPDSGCVVFTDLETGGEVTVNGNWVVTEIRGSGQ